MKAITLRQPWAWAIINAGKDIENRNWKTHFRGRVAIHAAAGMTRGEYDRACEYIRGANRKIKIPAYEDVEDKERLLACAQIVIRRLSGMQIEDRNFTFYGAVHELEEKLIEQALELEGGASRAPPRGWG